MHDLTIGDGTQKALSAPLRITEEMLAMAAGRLSGRSCSASIYALPDLGMPHNVTRIAGGFFTGALYSWDTDVPFVPIDTTVNVDSVGLFRVSVELDSAAAFDAAIARARSRIEDGPYVWNFNVGNHFITYGTITGSRHVPDGCYLALHGSAAEFKKQYHGLYPEPGNWFYDKIVTLRHPDHPGRYLRYIHGRDAEEFYRKAESLEAYNRERHIAFAQAVCGHDAVQELAVYSAHYGMPNQNSVAIGCQLLNRGDRFLLLTAPRQNMYLLSVAEGVDNRIADGGRPRFLQPHGLGKRARGPLDLTLKDHAISLNGRSYVSGESLIHDPDLEIRCDVDDDGTLHQLPLIVNRCPAEQIGVFTPLYSHSVANP